jgi:hypothetical protein
VAVIFKETGALIWVLIKIDLLQQLLKVFVLEFFGLF